MQDNKLIKALVLNAQLGNNSAFEQLYQMTVQQIFALTMRLAWDFASAEKFAKKTYVNAWQKISQKDEFASFAGWLKKIAIETVLEEKNGDKPTQESSGESKQIINEMEEKFFNANPLEKFIRELEFQSKVVYVLHDIENLPYEEIAKLLGITIEEARTLLVKTRENLINLTEE